MKRQESERMKQARVKLSSAVGVTMVEMLLVIAIIGILSGVAFIAVWNYQRSMGQLERDNIAKEIFVAAQNHLTMAKGEGYRGVTAYGTSEDSGKDVFYYVVNNGAASSGGGMFAQMLPFGSIDETVRGGGSYLIRYQPKMGLVLDVFYCSTSGSPSKFNHTLSEDEYSHVMGLKGNDHKGDRRTYVKGDNSILGWYGGEDGANLPSISLKAPSIEVFNGDTLYVKVTDAPENTGDHSLKLILTGNLSTAQKSFVLRKSSESSETVEKSIDSGGRLKSDTTYEIVLDDITTSGMHFRTILGERDDIPFIPGEDVTVQAVAYSTSALANIAYSESRTTNSLFADGTSTTQALIGSFRHLENLDKDVISDWGNNDSRNQLTLGSAVQIKDLNWSDFSSNSTIIYGYTSPGSNSTCVPATQPYCYYPVSSTFANDPVSYDGKNHKISGVKINHNDNVGLFGTTLNLSVSNLQLIDFSVTSTLPGAGAGALAGTMSQGCSVSNVVAFNSPANDSTFKTNANINSTGAAGGLIGSLSTGCSLTNCAAALYVSGTTSAGGLAGTSMGRITGCYSGGHTDRGEYYKHDSNGQRTDPIYNVTATGSSGVAGGLVGDAGSSTILNSYSTCSVSGTTAGGFVGSASGSSITNCYATGLVSKSEITTDNDSTTNNAKGAFAGSLTEETTASNCSYYSIVNEVLKSKTVNGETTKTLDHYLGAVGDTASTGITPFDLNAETFNTFTGAWDDWAPAKPYDSTLVGNYGGKYNLKAILRPTWSPSPEINPDDGTFKSIIRPDSNNTGLVNSGPLDGSAITDYFVSTHYGDWPSPEVFFVNKK